MKQSTFEAGLARWEDSELSHYLDQEDEEPRETVRMGCKRVWFDSLGIPHDAKTGKFVRDER